MNHFEELDQTWVNNLQQKTANYIRRLDNNRLDDCFFARDKDKENGILVDSLLGLFFLVLGAPLYIYGLLTNLIPYRLTGTIAEAVANDEEYLGPVKMTVGMFVYTTFYAFLMYLFGRFIAQGDWWWTLSFMVSLPAAGFFAMFYFQRLHHIKTHWQLIATFYKNPTIITELFMERKAIVADLDWAKEQYLR